ncbi:winged helix-turn-helix transcriptional regulator [Modestobacter roseus]|uniref:winged helix-turn-helix transcriptional regulator n=1 Tax=Modestobacter roseus TaxID=1181884 RepID=UPI0034DF7602
MSAGHTGGTDLLEPCGRADHPDCGIRDVLDRVGDTWSVLVLSELSAGTRRFGELQRAVAGVSQRMLTLTVRRLERDGLVTRTVYPTVPAAVTYALTDRGRELSALVRGLAEWSLANRAAIAGSRESWDAAHPGSPVR